MRLLCLDVLHLQTSGHLKDESCIVSQMPQTTLSIASFTYALQMSQTTLAYVAFLIGNSKVAPRVATSIPRRELCAAVEVAHSARYFERELGRSVDSVNFYSDNSEKRFSRYVTSRVRSVLNTSHPNQWSYVSTHENPADIASRAHTPYELVKTQWLVGPNFLRENNKTPEDEYLTSGTSDIELPETIKRR